MRQYDRYLSIVEWARRRYTKNGVLVMDHGGIKSAYSRIECAAFEKYMRCTRDEEGCLVFP